MFGNSAFSQKPNTIATQPTNSLFGANNAPQNPTQGSIFQPQGFQQNPTQQQGFGSKQTTNQPSFGFQQPGTQQQPAPTQNIFGNTQQQSAFATQPTNNLFGNQQMPQQTSLFQPQASQGFQQTQQPQAMGQQNPFGAPQTSSMFGSQPPASIFGNKPQIPGQTFQPQGFQPNASQFQGFQPNTSQFQQQQPVQQPQTILESMGNMKNQWDPQNPSCQFKHYLFNMVNPNEIHLYSRPQNQDASFWDQAQSDNPDPSCMVPVLAVGYESLNKRIQEQQKQCVAHSTRLEECKASIENLLASHQISTIVKLQEYKRKHKLLSHRVLQMMTKVHVLRNKGYTIRADEESLKTKLSSIQLLMQTLLFKTRTSQISSKIKMFEEREKSHVVKYDVIDSKSVELLYQALCESQNGLSYLLDTVKTDQKDLDVIYQSFNDSLLVKQ